MTADRWLAVALVVVSGLITWIVSRYYYRRSDKAGVFQTAVRTVRLADFGNSLPGWFENQISSASSRPLPKSIAKTNDMGRMTKL